MLVLFIAKQNGHFPQKVHLGRKKYYVEGAPPTAPLSKVERDKWATIAGKFKIERGVEGVYHAIQQKKS